jgi:hypothetical protein
MTGNTAGAQHSTWYCNQQKACSLTPTHFLNGQATTDITQLQQQFDFPICGLAVPLLDSRPV